MAPHAHRRQVLLFLAAVLLPCAALIALGLRLVVQERELAASRLQDERRRITRQLRQDLSSRLERTALRQVTTLSSDSNLLRAREYDDSAVVLVARVSKGQLILPWEHGEGARESRALRARGEFGERLRQGERLEFAVGDAADAIEQYRQALAAARQPVQKAQARLSLARALARAGRHADARVVYGQLVRAPPDVVDENGIPIALFAARQLIEANHIDADVREALGGVLSATHWQSPPTLYLLRDLVGSFGERISDSEPRQTAQQLSREVSRELARTERALTLEADFASLGIRVPDSARAYPESTWIPYGTPAWLVGAAPVGGAGDGIVVAVLAEPVLTSVQEGVTALEDAVGRVALTTENGAGGEALGAGFPGLFVRFDPLRGPPNTRTGSVRWWFYSAGFFLVIGVTLFGAYLLWRDVRREVQLAETRSRFVAAVSHELKTPLTAIRMFAETLQDGGTVGPDAQDEYLETIVNESERLTRLLNNVLDFSKIEGGRKTYRREPASLEEIVRSTAGAMRYPLEQNRFAFRLEIEDDLPAVRVDQDAIEQAILNLLSNAMKYSGANRDIELRLRSEAGNAVIEVSDRGVGIEPAEVHRIFDRFYRVPSPENDRIPGAGLGLTLVQHIAQAHGGRVTLRSEPGEGSTFSLVIPLDGAAA